MKPMGIPRGVSRRRQYFLDKFLTLWLSYRHELSEEEQLLLNLGFGLSGEVLSYTEIAQQLNYSGSKNVGRLIEDALNHLRKAAKKNRAPSNIYAK